MIRYPFKNRNWSFYQSITKSEGFSLTEVLITLIFVGIVMVPLCNLLQAVFKTDYITEKRLKAVRVAQGEMEEIIALPFEDVKVSKHKKVGKDKKGKNSGKTKDENANLDDYLISLNVQNISPAMAGLPVGKNKKSSDLKLVTVTVSWLDGDSIADSVRVAKLLVKEDEKGETKPQDAKSPQQKKKAGN